MGVAPPSVTAVLKRLTALGLIEHERYRGAVLTPAGKKVAIELIRHHRLLEQYLSETLGLEIDGKNPRYEDGRPVELNVKVDTNLPALLRASRSVSGVPDVIERRLRGRVPPDG